MKTTKFAIKYATSEQVYFRTCLDYKKNNFIWSDLSVPLKIQHWARKKTQKIQHVVGVSDDVIKYLKREMNFGISKSEYIFIANKKNDQRVPCVLNNFESAGVTKNFLESFALKNLSFCSKNVKY